MMERKPPIVTSLSNRLAFIYTYLDVALSLLIGSFIVGFVTESIFLYGLAGVCLVWLFGVIIGSVPLRGIIRWKLTLVFVGYLFVATFSRSYISSVEAIEYSNRVVLYVLLPLLYLIIASVGKLSRLVWYVWGAILVFSIKMLQSYIANTPLDPNDLMVVTFLVLWVWYGYRDAVMKVVGVLLIVGVLYLWFLQGFANIPIELYIGLFVMFAIGSIAVVLLPLIGLAHKIWINLDSLKEYPLRFMKQIDLDVLRSVFAGTIGALVLGHQIYTESALHFLLSFGIIAVIVVSVLMVSLFYYNLREYHKTLLPQKKGLHIVVLGVCVTYVLLGIFNLEAISDPVFLFVIYLLGVSTLTYAPSNS